MRVHHVATVVVAAAATMALTLTLFGPGVVGAGSQANNDQQTVKRPTLTLDDCQIALVTERSPLKPGDKPKLQLEASNPTDKPVSATVHLQLLASMPSSPMSRMVMLPETIWKHDHLIELKPGEKRTVPVTVDHALPENKSVTFTMGDKQKSQVAHPLIVVEPQFSLPSFQVGNLSSLPAAENLAQED